MSNPKFADQGLDQDDALGVAVLDALPAEIAVIDRTGTIIAVNRAWRQFARENGDPDPRALARGANYIEVCRRAAGPGRSDAELALRGILAVLRGERPGYAMEYPCHSVTQQRWFLMHVAPLRRAAGGAVVTHVDISARRAAEAALRQAKEYAEHILDVAGVIFVLLDSSGRVTKLNRKGCEVLGCTEAEALGKDWIESFVPPRLRAEVGEVFRQVLAGDVTLAEHYENPVCGADGSERLIAWHNAFLRGPEGAIAGVISSGQDITDERRALEALRAADRSKDEFLAMLGHELRNPLAPIRNAAAALRRLLPPGERPRWALDLIDRQVATMGRLVDDLLDLSRISRGGVTLRRAPVDLGGVARDAIEAAQPLLAARGHRLAVSLPSSAVRVDADPVRLAQVIVNLLDNAAKYTEPGGQIWLTVAPRDAEAMVQVRDTGMGISEDLLPHIFEPFAQGARTLDRAQGGLGIGLALVRRVVGLHGGRVEARSPGPGQGAEFTVWLPLSTHQATAGTPAAPVADPMGRRLRVLVVDDDTAVTESMVVLLRLEGHEVVSATSGPDALALAAEFHPQAALLDIGLKGMSGYDLARQLRLQAERDQRLLLVAVSGYGHETALTESKAAGFDLHLVKPVPPNELSAVLARHAAQLEAEGTTSAGRDPVR